MSLVCDYCGGTGKDEDRRFFAPSRCDACDGTGIMPDEDDEPNEEDTDDDEL
jgi:hypothetical protein